MGAQHNKEFWRVFLLRLVALSACLVFTKHLTSSYGARLNAIEGFHRVVVRDVPAVLPRTRPRHVWLVVLDGLRRDAAQEMQSMKTLVSKGWCVDTIVGPITLSRAVYTTLSTGLDSDRTGVRDNETHQATPVDNIWSQARAQGLRTGVVSLLTWWTELFPNGFSDVRRVQLRDDVFASAPDVDLGVLHVLEIDEEGHEHGAHSPEYRDAVAHADVTLERFLARSDLTRDTVVVTADHGHTSRGGHGGVTDDVSRVLTCAAGHSLSHRDLSHEQLRASTIPGLLSVVARVPFPQEMAPIDFDFMAALTTLDTVDPAWASDRRHALESYRTQNAQYLSQSQARSWEEFARREQRIPKGLYWLTVCTFAFVLMFLLRDREVSWSWMEPLLACFILAATLAAYLLLRGSFDLSSVNKRSPFIVFMVWLSGSLLCVASLVRWLRVRQLRSVEWMLCCCTIIAHALAFAHPTAFGYEVKWPLPAPSMLLLPYPIGLFAAVSSVVWVVCALLRLWRDRSSITSS